MVTIEQCNQEIYPNVFKLLQIFATLPVSSSSNKRSFSNLKRIKTYLRNIISQVNFIFYFLLVLIQIYIILNIVLEQTKWFGNVGNS